MKPEPRMKSRSAMSLLFAATLLACCAGSLDARAQTTNPETTNPGGTTSPGGPGAPTGDTGLNGAIQQKLLLTPEQRVAIYQEVSKDKSKVAPKDFSPVIGADVPPMIELYMLPDDATASVPAAKLYKYTMVENKVVLVDPTKMRVIDVIGPPPSH
jgi:hypothetical protein